MTQAKFGARTTALQAVAGRDLSGQAAVLTGANSGIGVETARALAYAGADVVICSRSLSAGEAVAEEIWKSGAKGKVIVKHLDLAVLATLQRLATDLHKELPRIDLLVLNAGVLTPGRMETRDGFEMQIGTNHIGHQYLTELLLPLLKQSPAARVVSVSSIAHKLGGLDVEDLNWERRTYRPWLAYGQSKLANILFAKELTRRMKEERAPVMAFSLHPGIISTGISRSMQGGPVFQLLAGALSWMPGIKTVEQGAATTVYAATSPELASQPGAFLRNCAVEVPSKAAQDAELARRLWAKTDELIQAALKRREAAAAE